MFRCFIRVTTFFIILQQCFSQRRILDGHIAEQKKPYMVYIVKSQEADVKYDAWVCGGALVTSTFIITSAACIEDVRYMYAIAGYDKYINGDEIYTDPCTSHMKKKIIMTCTPQLYELDYDKVEKWSSLDIAVAEVESPYELGGQVPTGCTHAPDTIDINYHSKYQAAGVDAMVLGWGHTDKYRKPEDKTDYNQKELHWSSVLIVSKKVCKEKWIPELTSIIDKYMICTYGSGLLDEKGGVTGGRGDHYIEGCDGRRWSCSNGQCHKGANETRYRRALYEEIKYDQTRRSEGRNGFCQNDHGGPLIGWVGSKPILLGVQSAFLVDGNYKCQGPFLHTSTHCNGAFLHCVLKMKAARMGDCGPAGVKYEFEMLRTAISWKNHTDGPADNELVTSEHRTTTSNYYYNNIGNNGYISKNGNDDYRGNIGNNGYNGYRDNYANSGYRSNNANNGDRVNNADNGYLRNIDSPLQLRSQIHLRPDYNYNENITLRLRPQIPLF